MNDFGQQLSNFLIEQEELDSYKQCQDEASIKMPSDFFKDVLERYNPTTEAQGGKLPWQKCSDKVRFRPGEVTLWGGYNGHKKSMVTGQVMLDLIRQGFTACIASLEMHPASTLMRITNQAICNPRPTPEILRKFFSYLERNLYLYDQQNTVPTERILKMAGLCGDKLKLDHLVIDSLMKCGMATDDYNGQKKFVNELCATAKGSGIHIHLVTHLRKPSNDKKRPDRYDIAGGSDIPNQADNVFMVWADMEKVKELNEPPEFQDTKITSRHCQELIIEKQRNGEFEGKFNLWFDHRSLQMKEYEKAKPHEYWRAFE